MTPALSILQHEIATSGGSVRYMRQPEMHAACASTPALYSECLEDPDVLQFLQAKQIIASFVIVSSRNLADAQQALAINKTIKAAANHGLHAIFEPDAGQGTFVIMFAKKLKTLAQVKAAADSAMFDDDAPHIWGDSVNPMGGFSKRTPASASFPSAVTRYPELATDESMFAFVGAASELDDDFDVDEAKAEKMAGNRGFLKGMMKRIRNLVLGTNPDGMSTARKLAIGSSILFVCTALRLALTQPDKFGRMGADTAKLFGAWCVEMAKFVGAVLKGTGSFLLARFRSLLAYLQSLRAPLARAAYRGAYRGGQAYQHTLNRMTHRWS